MSRSILAFGLAVAAAALSQPAVAQFAGYDYFTSSTIIEPDRWQRPERFRGVVGGQLQLIQRDWGNQFNDTGFYANTWSLNPTVADSKIRQLRANIKVVDYQVTGCPANSTEVSGVAARLIGSFFNTGVAVPGSRVNDVGATVQVTRRSDSNDPPNVLRVEGVIFKCTNETCGGLSAQIGQPVDMGTAVLGEPVQLRLDWDPANSRFIFRRGSTTYFAPYSGVLSVGSAPGVDFKNIATRTVLANCFSGPRTSGYVNAYFDNVFLNASALQ